MNDNEIKKGNAVNKDTKGVTTTAFFAKATSVSFTQTSTTKVVEVVSDSSSWTCSSNKSWCTVTKATVNSNNLNELIDYQPMGAVKIEVSKNTTGNNRSATVTLSRSGMTNITISVSQAATGAPVVDRSGSLFYLHQTKSDNCAGACCCMVAKKAMCEVSHTITDSAQWNSVAQTAGLHCDGWVTANNSLIPIYNLIETGHPVIVQVNDGSDGNDPHWVVAYSFNGLNPTVPQSFMCADPNRTDLEPVPLSSATNFTGVYKYAYFY